MDFFKGVRKILSGEIILEKLSKRKILYILLFFGLALLYVVNHFHGIYVYREINKSEERLEKLRAEDVAIQSELLKKTNRRNSVLKLLESKGSTLMESKTPPHKIIYDKRKTQRSRKDGKK
ncbi:MAG: hypothetical protein J6W06_02370 [Bacteroidales bacterium]|jgi:hypothetical protein|nr:hypothetical protein [Bacteroidales bacterium]